MSSSVVGSPSKKFRRRHKATPVTFDRRAFGSRRIDPLERAASAVVAGLFESLEHRELLAAHIIGSTTSYATIQAAVNAAVAGQTITVDAGTYDETVSIYVPLTIKGAEAGVDARNTRGAESIVYATQTVFNVYANDVTIDGFTIEGDDANIGGLQGAGVLMRPNIHGTHVLNDIIQDNVTGVYLSNNSNSDQCLIQHCLIQNNFETGNNWQTENWNGSRGIYTDGTVSGGYLTNVLIDSNTIFNSTPTAGDEDEGIIALQALTAGKQFNITISNNYWGNDSKALLATNVTNLTVIGNYVTGTVDGSSGPVRFEGDANNVDIQYNTITGNGGPGVAVDDSGVSGDNSGFVVDYNNIYNNDSIGFITQSSLYDGTVYTQGDWWGSTTGPSGDGPGTGSAVWANGTSGHFTTPSGLAGGSIVFSPWATALINIASIPAPTASSGLTVSPAAGNQLTLSWTAPSSTALGQYIQRSTDGVNFTTVATVPPLLNSFTDTGLATGATYYYRVETFNNAGTAAPSNSASGIPPAYQPPVAVSGITLASTTGTTNTLSWNLPDYIYGIASYTVYRNGVAVGTSLGTTFLDTGLTPNTAYTYTITTTDTMGATSAASAATPILSGPSQFQDPSFELSPNVNVFDPATANWTFTGRSAIEIDGGGFGSPAILNGTQFAVIQGYDGNPIGAISQTVPVSPAGTYTISFQAAQRAGYTTEPITVTVDGILIGTISPTSASFNTYSTSQFNLTAGTHTITFSGTLNSSDDDSFIDAVSLNKISSTVVPAAPVDLVAAAASPTQVNLNWAPGDANAGNFYVIRSTDDVNWTSISGALLSTVTSYIDTSALASTQYYYAVYATNGNGSSPASNIVPVTTLSSGASVTKLSTLAWTSATSGYLTVQKNASVKGNTLTLHGTTYASGLGTSAASVITYNLGGAYTTFTSDIGIDAEENGAGAVLASVDFQVLGDGRVLYDSGDLGINSPTVHITVPVTGVQTLTLVATNGVAGIAYDHADWAGAQLLTNPSAASAPTGLAAVAVSTSSIGITWTPPTTAVTGYALDRSTDGVNFTTIATGLSGAATSYTDSSGLSAGTIYYYRIRATNFAGTSANSTVANASTLTATPTATTLTSFNWISATAGYGTVQKYQSISGNTLTLHSTTYSTGLGTHAASTITYNLAGKYNVFLSDVGIDAEETAGTGSVDFQVIGDGRLLYDSGILTNASPTDHFAVNVTGVQTLTLLANNGVAGSIDYDHSDWAGAGLLANATAPSAPINVTAVATGTSSINLTWAAGSTNQTSFAIDRSTDGVNFTTLVTNVAASAASYVDSSALAASTKYYYRIRAANTVGTSPNSSIANATTLSTVSVSTPLSSLNWTSATAGYGTVQKNLSIKGNTLTLHGVTYASGIGTHAASTITYSLAGNYTTFTSDVGIDDEEIGVGSGSVDFQVIGDGQVLFDTGVLTSSSPTVHIAVSVAGVQTLQLVATNGVAGNIDYDHADWAGATLLSNAVAPAAPTNLAATGIGPSLVKLTWTAPSGSLTSYTVSRSTDGVNFTTVATGISASVTTWTDVSVLSASTKYYYEIQAVNVAGSSSNSNIASGTTLGLMSVTYVSNLTATSSTVGYGTIQQNKSISGNPLTLGGVVYASGIGTHAASSITYNIAGKYSTFFSEVGIDQEEDGKGSGYVDFEVIGDGKVLFDSGVLTNDQVDQISVNVSGVQTLTLIANNGIANSIDYDHADWAGTELLT